ncbi:unnamed protein product [Orchesella dallaii]|uniref:non-specific serine/threonine protein kinase n=1 Tax=Orchesella dallaii TaxID=48710 RepID=A0ABP1RUH6_9HEXA
MRLRTRDIPSQFQIVSPPPPPSPIGNILTDENGGHWKVGSILGAGQFGEAYLVRNWMNEHKLKCIGIPHYVASGTHQWEGKEHHFLVIPKFGRNLQELLDGMPGKRLQIKVAQGLALQIIDILEYIHSKGYVHCDIKNENILLEFSDSGNKLTVPKIYLVDYGLVNKHEERSYPDQYLAGWGTLAVMARDAHLGAFPRRGDLESLAYNMIEWSGGKLPWVNVEGGLTLDQDEVFARKEVFMEELNLETLYTPGIKDLDPLKKFLNYIGNLGRVEAPDYSKCRQILSEGMQSNGISSSVSRKRKDLQTKSVKRLVVERPGRAKAANLLLVSSATNTTTPVYLSECEVSRETMRLRNREILPESEPESLLINEVLTDEKGKHWWFGKRLGTGAFGEVYLGSNLINAKVDATAKYIIKWESEANLESGFEEEIKFYKAVARESKLRKWEKTHKLESLGIPHYVASGTHSWAGKEHKFLVLPRLGKNLRQFIQKMPEKRLPIQVVYALGLQMIDILEYIHSTGYVHDDIKDSNVLLDVTSSENRNGVPKIYLADYGLVNKYEYRSNPHRSYVGWGTSLFMARDAHKGAYPRRGDLESLIYNMIEWGGGELPWLKLTNRNPPPRSEICKMKEIFMKDPSLKNLFRFSIKGLNPFKQFIKYVGELEREEKPDYSRCRQILSKGLANTKDTTPAVSSSSKELGTERLLRKRPLQPDTANMPVKKRTKYTK